MGLHESVIPDKTVEVLARGFFKQSLEYGFKKVDYLRFVNALLDMAMSNSKSLETNGHFVDDFKIDKSRSNDDFPLYAERVTIRAFEDKDKDLLQEWLKDESGRQFLLSRTTAQTIKIDDFANDKSCLIGIITIGKNKPIGAVAFCDINPKQHRAELRKMIGDTSARGKGYAKEATRLWLQFGVQKFKLKKIYLGTLDTNIGNIKLNEELGFQVEGILRNEVYFDDQYHDILRMGMLIEE
jgi:RimJ/RimL family protein N-acetyltransferase